MFRGDLWLPPLEWWREPDLSDPESRVKSVDYVDEHELAAQEVVEEVELPSQVLPDPKLIRSWVAVDVETDGLFVDDGARICATSVAYRLDDGLWYHAFPFDVGRWEAKGHQVARNVKGVAKGDPGELLDWDEDVNLPQAEWDYFIQWMDEAGAAAGLTNQNIRFDLHHLLEGPGDGSRGFDWKGIDLERHVRWDTMLATAHLDPRAGTTSLKPTAARVWGPEAVAEATAMQDALLEVKKRFGFKKEDGPHYDLVPWSIHGPYAGKDTILALQLSEHQIKRLADGEGDTKAIEQAIELMRVLFRIERRGFGPYDVERSRRIAQAIDDRVGELHATLVDVLGGNPTAQRASRVYFEELGLGPGVWKPGDQPRGKDEKGVNRQGTLDYDVAVRLAAAGAPGAAEYAEYIKLGKMNQMFYRNYADLAGRDRRLRTSFRQAHVRSGRMSVERFQCQALPKGLHLTLPAGRVPEPRLLFGVDEGKVRVNLDLSQAELRLAAKFCKCQVMLDALATGADFHGMTTEKVFGITKENPRWSELRDIAKRLTFGSIFQIGPPTFQKTLQQLGGITWPLADCKDAVYAWRKAYPQFGEAYNHWMNHVESYGWVELYDGTRSFFSGPRDYPNTAWSRIVQGSLASWVGNVWLPEVERMTQEYEALTLTVHDSVVLELPEEVADEVTKSVVARSEKMWLESFGIPGRVDAGPWLKA